MDELIRELKELNELAAKLETKLKNLINKTKFTSSPSKKVRQAKKSVERQLKVIKSNISKTKTNISRAKATLRNRETKVAVESKGFGEYHFTSTTPLDSIIKNKGIAASMWNVIDLIATPEKTTDYWLKVIESVVARYGLSMISNMWFEDYFYSAFGYDATTDNYITDTATGESVMESYEELYEYTVDPDRLNELKSEAVDDD